MSENLPQPASSTPLNVDAAVRERYSAASQAAEPALCCPVDYDQQYLSVIPEEILERDYGCGDPSKHIHPGETVLDLGSGGGKICYIASQVVGSAGRVIGIDTNDDMLALARRYQQEVAERIGYSNVEFRKGRIQDLALDLELFEKYLAAHPVNSSTHWLAAQEHAHELRQSVPLVVEDSVDVVVSNCVLNLVHNDDRRKLFAEVFRVLKPGGRAVISDITCDEPVPEHLQRDPELWSGCLSGAFVEQEFLNAFEEAGFHGLTILERQQEPWAVVEGIEFRSLTLCAYKSAPGQELDRHQAVIYRGPFKAAVDEDGLILERGQRTAVSAAAFERFCAEPYTAHLVPIPPAIEVPEDEAEPFDAESSQHRVPQKMPRMNQLPQAGDCCGPGECC